MGDFPKRAMDLYRWANLTGVHRAINTLGIARANTQLRNYAEATRLYRVLQAQMNTSNATEVIFLQELNGFINGIAPFLNSAVAPRFSLAFAFALSMIGLLYF